MALISTRSALESSVTPNRSNPNCTISERHVEQATGSEVRAVTIAVTADQLGHNRVTLRCDNEPAIVALAGEVPQARQEGSQTVPENHQWRKASPIWIIERAVGLVAGQARTLKAALEHRIGTRVPNARTPLWLVEFAASLVNRQGRKDTFTQAAWAKGQHTDPGIWREGLACAGQASKRRKVGTAIPSKSVGRHAELVVRGSGCHRVRAGDQDTRSERQENS